MISDRYIAIGDIHGLALALDALLDRIPADGTLVFLGDYIDRGLHSPQVVARLLRLEHERPCVFLRGNHEAMLLASLAGIPGIEEIWLRNGGRETLESYRWEIPDDHLAFFARSQLYYPTAEYIFVHAGLVPGEAPEQSEPDQLLWIREPFLSSTYDWGRLVVHGHTPTEDGLPDFRVNRLNVDTGAVYGRALTAVVLPEMEFIAVTGK